MSLGEPAVIIASNALCASATSNSMPIRDRTHAQPAIGCYVSMLLYQLNADLVGDLRATLRIDFIDLG